MNHTIEDLLVLPGHGKQMLGRILPNTIRSLFASATLAVSLGGCAEVEDEMIDPELVDLSAETVEIVENLELAGYPREEIEIDEDEVVIVGGDAVVTLEASREMIPLDDDDHDDDHDHSFRQYRTTNLVDSSVEVICIDMAGIVTQPLMVIAAQQTASMYNQQNLSFELMTVVGSHPHCDAVIETQLQGGTGASAGFPSGGLPYDEVIMGTGINAYGLDVVRHVFMHEVGHCIGLRHSDFFNRSLSCGSGGNEGSAGIGAHYIPGTHPGFDPASVMNACYSSNSSGVFSIFDTIALGMVY